MRSERLAGVALIALAAASAASAAEPAPLPDIIVTGTGLQQPLGSAAYDIVTIDRKTLNSTASGRIESALLAAGITRFRRADATSAHPTSQGVTMRGLGGNAASRGLIMLDGVPLADPFGGQVPYSALDPSRLGLVRVVRGGGSGVYGPGALAGTIELESATPGQLMPGWASLFYGSRNSLDLDGGVAGRIGTTFATIGGSFQRSDGFVPTVKADRGPADKAAPYRQWSVSARTVTPIGAQTEAQLMVNAFGDKRTRGLIDTHNESKGVDASVRLVGHGSWAWSAASWVQFRKLSSQFASVNAPRTVVTETLDQYGVPATGIGGRFELRPPLGKSIELRIGADGQHDDGKTKERYSFVAGNPTMGRVAGGNSTDVGGFIEASAKLTDALTVTASGRIDRWWISDGRLQTQPLAGGAVHRTNYPNRSGWRPTARAGVAWKPTGAVTLRGAAYLGWRLPTLNELYRPYRVGSDATVANAALKPERLRGFDLGVEFRPLSTLRLSATYFNNRLEDAIANVTITDPVFKAANCKGVSGRCIQRQNVDAIQSQGLELEAGARVGDVDLDLSYDLIDAHVRAHGSQAALDGLRPAQTPHDQLNGTIAWRPAHGPSASMTLHYVSRQFDDDQNQVKLRSAVTLDADVSVPVWNRLRAELRVENLTNKLVDVGYSNGTVLERATPRTVWLGLRWGG